MIYHLKKYIERMQKAKNGKPCFLYNGREYNFSEQAAFVTHILRECSYNPSHPYYDIAEQILDEWFSCLTERFSSKEELISEIKEDLNHKQFQPVSSDNVKFRFIDLFAGIGGFRLALQQLGGRCVFSSEWDCAAQETYYDNYGEVPFGDITKIAAKEIPDFDILCAGFPCQPFSICGQMKGFDDTRGTLFFDVCRIIEEKRPSTVILENVKHLVNHDHKRTFKMIVESLERLGYNVSYKVMNSNEFGVAQSRERIIIVATRNGSFDFTNIETLPPVYIKDIIDNDSIYEYLKPGEYTLLEPSLTKTQKTGLIFCGYRNKPLRKTGVMPNTEHLSRSHKQPDRIYSADGIHPTIPSQEISRRFWIYLPEEHVVRKLTLKECYRLMGFPENFVINNNASRAMRQCGNSVVVPMIYQLGKAIMEQGYREESFGIYKQC